MSPTDLPSSGAPKLNRAANVVIVNDQDEGGRRSSRGDGTGGRSGEVGSGGSPEALPKSTSPATGPSGDCAKTVDSPFMDLPPRKRSRNTSYSGRFESGR